MPIRHEKFVYLNPSLDNCQARVEARARKGETGAAVNKVDRKAEPEAASRSPIRPILGRLMRPSSRATTQKNSRKFPRASKRMWLWLRALWPTQTSCVPRPRPTGPLNMSSSMALSSESIDCIQWWIDNLHKAFKPILISKPDRIIESDGSLTGYGAHDVTYNQEFSGLWTGVDQQHHINFLELKAAFLSPEHLCGNVTNEHTQLFLDNMTAIKYLSKMGGRKERLNALTKEIWLWCLDRNIYISAFHIPGDLNTRADNLSRQKLNLDMEWTLRKDVFVRIMDLYGPCDIDLFASSDNHQLPQYVSYLPDPKAVAVNAFSLLWTNLFPFIFCPFSVINSVLQKLEQDQAEAVMVAPSFTTQPWFPRLLQQVSAPPVLLPKVGTILLHPNNKSSHPLQKMTLGVFRVSGKNSVIQDFQMTLPTSSSIPGDLQRINSMGHITRNGCCFVVKGKLISINHL